MSTVLDPAERDARRRRGRIIAVAAVVLFGIPALVFTWCDRQARHEADELAAHIEAWAEGVTPERFEELTGATVSSFFDAFGDHETFATALGIEDPLTSTLVDTGRASIAVPVRWGVAELCVHALVEPGAAEVVVDRSGSCQARSL